MIKNTMIKTFLKTLEKIEFGSLKLTTPTGVEHEFRGQQPGPDADITIHNWQTITAFVAKGDIGLTESYRDNLWDTTDLTALLIVGQKNETALSGYLYGGAFAQWLSRIAYFFSQNTLKGSRRNIHAHYDLGNDFYKLWLDPTMSYSSALFQTNDDSLETAQQQKYDRILTKLAKNSGRLLEIGCGWGGFAERAIQNGDFATKGITLSNEQHAYAKKRLGNQAEIVIEDYRHQTGQYDHIVSIEMFEAVGEKYWPTYFSKIRDLLTDNGQAVVQAITIDERFFERYRKTGDMIRTFIFPGGMLPSPERFIKTCDQVGLKVTDQFSFGKDYAKTLQIWLQKFDEKYAEVKALGFDDGFIKVWRFYLAACAASFTIEKTNVYQMVLEKS